jgi:N-carbamoyl-L-amino-acid hydrolase
VRHDAHEERGVALREICRIAHFRLADLVEEPLGDAIIAMAEDLASFSEESDALTCSYLTPAHRATAARIRDFMLAAGLATHIDAVGNVVGVLEGGPTPSASSPARTTTPSSMRANTMAGSASSCPLPWQARCAAPDRGCPTRSRSSRLPKKRECASNPPSWAAAPSPDASSSPTSTVSMQAAPPLSDAIRGAGHDLAAIPAIARDASRVACFVEVHIEQGPVLLEAALPVGVVTRITGSVRSAVTVEGLSGHAGTVPMALRRDAAAAAAEMVLAVERRCSEQPDLVGTVGKLDVPRGAVNVIPGRCEFSIDIRSGSDALRDAAAADVSAAMQEIAARRRVKVEQRRVLQAASVPCAAALQDAWAASIERITGRPALRLPSGAGHDAMMMASLTDIGMLFVRCGNGGISHHPDETLSAADADVAARVFEDFLLHFKGPT